MKPKPFIGIMGDGADILLEAIRKIREKQRIEFDYFASKRKHLYDFYDSVTMIAIHTYKEQDFLLYAIDLEDSDKAQYMLARVTNDEIEQFKAGAKSFLEQKLNKGELYNYTFGLFEDSPQAVIRLLKIEEGPEIFPTEDFKISFEYDESYNWVI